MNRQPLELYIHIPFCDRKCAYCDFLSAPANEMVQHAYVEQLIKEIQVQSASCQAYGVNTIFIGGGTPSVLKKEELVRIMEEVHRNFLIDKDAEITIEINPGTVNKEKLEAYKACGINRISIGLQSADDTELKTLGRIHTYDEFLKTYQRVRVAGFTNVSVDLMSALPGQTLASWKSTLRKVTMLKPEHISAYSLIIEEDTPFYERYHDHGELLPGEDLEREIYYATKTFLKEQGYRRYEISNYAKSDHICRHNVGYWTGVEYLGLGLGASSCMEGYRFHNIAGLEAYKSLNFSAPGVLKKLQEEVSEITTKAKMEEFMFLGLRLTKGVSGHEFLERFGQNMWNVYGEVLKKLEANHLIQVESPYVRLTDFGIDVSNYVLSEFLL